MCKLFACEPVDDCIVLAPSTTVVDSTIANVNIFIEDAFGAILLLFNNIVVKIDSIIISETVQSEHIAFIWKIDI